MWTLCLEPIQSSGLNHVRVNIWSQMGCENIQIGLCTAGKNNMIKNDHGSKECQWVRVTHMCKPRRKSGVQEKCRKMPSRNSTDNSNSHLCLFKTVLTQLLSTACRFNIQLSKVYHCQFLFCAAAAFFLHLHFFCALLFLQGLHTWVSCKTFVEILLVFVTRWVARVFRYQFPDCSETK
jgi:hypothetical protein